MKTSWQGTHAKVRGYNIICMGKTWKEDAKLGGETGKQQTMHFSFMDCDEIGD